MIIFKSPSTHNLTREKVTNLTGTLYEKHVTNFGLLYQYSTPKLPDYKAECTGNSHKLPMVQPVLYPLGI